MRFLINNVLIIPMTDDGPRWFAGSVLVEDGVIAEVFRGDAPQVDKVVDGTGKLLMPGLINTHTHVAMTLMRNMADDVPLMEWLHERVWPFESKLTPQDIYVGARLGIAEMLMGGTTTMVDMYWHEAAVARAVEETGIRAVLCPCFIDDRMGEFETDLAETLSFKNELIQVRVAPHAAYSCSAENLRRGVQLAEKHNVGLHVHVSETRDEQEIVRNRFGKTPVGYLNSLGVFDLPTIAAHCVHVNGEDMEILKAKNVSVAHNPQSNMKLASGAAPVAQMLERGLNVSLGTDGAASNNDLDMWDEMRTAALLGKLTAGDPAALPAWEVLRMATVDGAKAIGAGGKLGRIKAGYAADLILVDTTGPHWQPLHDPVSAAVYSAKSSDVCAVWVAGRQRFIR